MRVLRIYRMRLLAPKKVESRPKKFHEQKQNFITGGQKVKADRRFRQRMPRQHTCSPKCLLLNAVSGDRRRRKLWKLTHREMIKRVTDNSPGRARATKLTFTSPPSVSNFCNRFLSSFYCESHKANFPSDFCFRIHRKIFN